MPPQRPIPARAARAHVPHYRGPFRRAQAERLLWRAGFGPEQGQAERFADLGLEGAVHALTHPRSPPPERPRPRRSTAAGSRRVDVWGHDVLWWLDRMVRTKAPLVERMTLVWHDWFATSKAGVDTKWMLRQNALLRDHALGNFRTLLRAVTKDPAMLVWLNGIENREDAPNENYARELQELFTLGAGRGYTEGDVRQMARALTGWRADWRDGAGLVDFRFDRELHDRKAEADLRQARRTTTGATPPTSRCATAATRASSSPSCGATSSPPRRRPPRGAGSSASTSARATTSARW